jgi:lipopolysaccharide export system protein LptA
MPPKGSSRALLNPMERNDMKKFPLCLLVITLSQFAWGQTVNAQTVPIPRARAVDAVEETGRVLQNAGAAGRAEAEKVSLDQSAGRTRLDQAVEKSQGDPADRSGAVERAMVDEANRKIGPALERVAPEGRALIAQSATAPALRAPDSADTTPTAVRAKPASEEGEAPIPLVRSKRDSEDAVPVTTKPGKTGVAGESNIDIVSQGALYFDSAQSMAVFTDDVVVNHPQFHLTCDELQVYMLKENEKPKEAAVAKPAAPGEAPKPKSDNSVKQAIATGRKVVIQKLSETGEMQIGISRSATYIGESGDIILREMPQVQRARNLIIATDRSTYMILKQNGELKVHGPSRTEIIQEAAKKTTAPATPGEVAPGTKPAPVVKAQPVDKPKGAVKKKDKGVNP